MAFSAELAKAGHTPTRVATKATVHLGADPAGGMRVSKIELDAEAQVPGIDNAKFQEIAEGARKGCPISKLLTGAPISLTAKLL
jgi:osmotically inducible protein OsmC